MYLSILLPSILALYALYKKKVTFPGTVLALSLGIIITYYGDFYAFGALALTFILAIVSDKLKRTKKDKTRNIYQIVSNVLTAGICIILFAVYKDINFYIIYYAVIASSLSDTLASSIGTLSKKKPVNIFTMEKLETGASGGVSLLGLAASLAGGVVIGLIYLLKTYDYSGFLLICLMGFMGAIIDSVLGVIFQSQYKCSECKEVVETKIHCHKKATRIRGYSYIDNNLVNLLSNVIVFVLCYILLI